MKAPAKQYDESLINYFDDEIVGHADTVYRFAFALTLSLDGAHRLTQRTYQEVAANLERFGTAEGSAAVARLLAECWKGFGANAADGAGQGSEATAVLKALKGIPAAERAALIAVDVAGLSMDEAGKVFGWSETDLRRKLAASRRALVASGLEA